jgi:hypothetical protein
LAPGNVKKNNMRKRQLLEMTAEERKINGGKYRKWQK